MPGGKAILKRLARGPAGVLRWLCFNAGEAKLARAYLSLWSRWQVLCHWRLAARDPDFFHHECDLFTWHRTGDGHWVERGVFPCRFLPSGAKVLDLCCGDGAYAFYFYRALAARVDAVDYSAPALALARCWHAAPNIRYQQLDVRTDPFPDRNYDAIIWNAFLDYFSRQDVAQVLGRIREHLAPTGVFLGYVVGCGEAASTYRDDIHRVGTAAELQQLLQPWFPTVNVLTTRHGARVNFYFDARA